MRGQLFFPFLVVNAENLDDALVLHIEVGNIDIVRAGQPANGRFDRAAGFFTAIDDPFQHSHIVAEAGPQEFSILAFAEPIYIENERRIGQPFSGLDPVAKIIADVVTAERQHCHRIAPHLPNGASRRCGCFRRHGCAQINAVVPIERLEHEWHSVAAAPAKNDRADRYAFAFFHIRIEHGVVAHRRGEAAVWMRRFFF